MPCINIPIRFVPLATFHGRDNISVSRAKVIAEPFPQSVDASSQKTTQNGTTISWLLMSFGNVLTQLDQHSICGFWMNKTNPFSIRTTFWLLLQKMKTGITQSIHFNTDITNLKCNMVNSFTFSVDEFRNRTPQICGFQQFNLVWTCSIKQSSHMFTGNSSNL